jgi:hypothetical protein
MFCFFYGVNFIPLFYSFFSSKVRLIHTVFFLKTHSLNIRGSCLKISLSLRIWDLEPQFLKVFPKFFKVTCWKIIIVQHVYTSRCQRHYRQNHKTVNLKSKERGIKKVWHGRATFARISKWRLKEIRCQRHCRQNQGTENLKLRKERPKGPDVNATTARTTKLKTEIEKGEIKKARC